MTFDNSFFYFLVYYISLIFKIYKMLEIFFNFNIISKKWLEAFSLLHNKITATRLACARRSEEQNGNGSKGSQP